MAVFEELKSQWENQSQPETPKDGVKRVMEKILAIRKKQQIANVVLAITGAVLIFFFFYISAYKFPTVMLGLLLMICALVLRIGIEFFSISRLKSLNVATDANRFMRQLTKYYRNRIKVHFILTPLLIVQYCIGFVMLLPSFKASLSVGFYNYIVISAGILLVILGLFIGKQIINEVRILKELNS